MNLESNNFSGQNLWRICDDSFENFKINYILGICVLQAYPVTQPLKLEKIPKEISI